MVWRIILRSLGDLGLYGPVEAGAVVGERRSEWLLFDHLDIFLPQVTGSQVGGGGWAEEDVSRGMGLSGRAVSYTHLTLPTNREG